MRLYEVEDSITQDLVVVLKNQLGRTDSVSHDTSSETLTYPALANLMNNMGYPGITKDSLKKLYDSSVELQKVIRDPQPAGGDPNSQQADVIVLKTAREKSKDVPSTAGQGPSVDTMAKSGASYKPELS
jgi:hypothetical protein